MIMATDYYLKLDPVKGESKADGHKGEIDILSFSFGATQPHLAHSGGGVGAGKVDVHDASFTHHVDRASADLMSACCKGTHIQKAIVTARKAGDKPLDFLIYTFEDVFVSSVQTGGSSGHSDDHPTETFSLNFQKFTVKYQEQNAQGGVAASPEFKYDIAARKAG
jgi:type VI secretion system secreted protein Hcp